MKSADSSTFITADAEGLLLRLHCLPNAPKTQIIGPHGDRLKIKAHAPPVDGKANQEIRDFFAKVLNLKKNQVALVAGEKSKDKTLRIIGIDLNEARNRIRELMS